ncbi:MAG: hypothetical protein KDF65_00470 [Anaerolineae bacterium]|nr:hypothetical protein [Anaerolineae bacterium]
MVENHASSIDIGLLSDALKAIREAQNEVLWKPGKGTSHLTKRIRLGHLPAEATLTEYESVIIEVLRNDKAHLYLFSYKNKAYPTLGAEISGEYWLVMIGLDGVIETAFPPDDAEEYLADPAFIYVGVMEELK